MFLNTASIESISYLIFYVISYNMTILSFFLLIIVSIGDQIKYNFALNSISNNIFNKIWISLILLSLAGLPPFIGFTSKILLISLIINFKSFLIFFFLFLFIILFLFFYIQNLKIIFSNSNSFQINNNFFMLNNNFNFINFINFISFLLIFNFFFIDDIFLIINFSL